MLLEIRTPLSGIMGSITLLAESNLSPEQQEIVRNFLRIFLLIFLKVHTAQVCGEQLLVVINDILGKFSCTPKIPRTYFFQFSEEVDTFIRTNSDI